MNVNIKRRTKGITLVSLVITIIIMLILAGVVTNLAISTEGLFSKAKKASEMWNDSNKKEEIMISELQGAREVYQNGVNAPRLGTNMIPVYYEDGWKKADSTNSENSWYQYGTTPETRKWANAVTVTEKNREKYIKANTGTLIKEEDIIGMFVWIPRYAYNITAGYHPASTVATPLEGMVDIKFLIGTTDEYDGGNAIRSNNTNAEENGGAYVVHPAFTADTANGGGSKESIGFWVAKFEASSNTTTASNPNLGASYGRTSNETDEVTVRPNVTSWRYISAPEIYEVCKKMNAEGNIHGLTSIVNPHMMKNSEWGAIAYLTQSEYGNPQTNDAANASGVWNNPYHEGDIVVNESGVSRYYTTMTGIVGSSRDERITAYAKATSTVDKSNSETIAITYQEYNTDGTAKTETVPYTRTYYRYQTTEGQKGSTTGNIYGIYDLAGGASEYVAGYLSSAPAEDSNGNETPAGYFKIKVLESEKQEYAGTGATDTIDKKTNYQANFDKYGDAIWETSREDAGASNSHSWNNDCAYFPYARNPFFLRGGNFSDGVVVGVFNFSGYGTSGYGNYGNSFRPVLGV